MNLKMTGIDFNSAGIDVRQRFSFTKSAMEYAMEQLREKEEIRGCIMISTCNRMELWLSLREGADIALPELLCHLKGFSAQEYRKYLTVRENEDAVKHLFYLSAGMKSQIVGEDQILSQVKESLEFARKQECTDKLLEVLFRMAVTAAKQVKTCVVMDRANFSAAHQAVDFLKLQGEVLTGKKCLVIGNGEMGKLAAQVLMEEGADVTVTVRQYKSGVVQIPAGAKRIDYGARYRYIPQCDLIISATTSPNITITREKLQDSLSGSGCDGSGAGRPQIYMDLAVPRDIEKSIAELDNIAYYDMDSLPVRVRSERMRSQYGQAEEILTAEIRKFMDRQERGDVIPRIQQIGIKTAEEFSWRMERTLRELSLPDAEKDNLRQQLKITAGKVVDKLLYELRDETDTETLLKVIEILEHIYQERK